MGWKECCFLVFTWHGPLLGAVSGGGRLPAMSRPVFFLFIAAPSRESLAWESINGAFDTASKMLFFLTLFLLTSLSLLALASRDYAEEVKGRIANAIMLLLSGLAILASLSLSVLTVLNSKTAFAR
ncbi:S-type anion channel SLAH4 [Populus trichocarpa]|uniref:S-type anion channel SLAH4 n=1 Tax=Populus trichocarpa TaxID=3694 RepID=UPI002278A93B|nr:S-type anion channel SLAH4 [Populus trichocarpa]